MILRNDYCFAESFCEVIFRRPELRGIHRSHAKRGGEDGVCAPLAFCTSKIPSVRARWRVRGPAGTGSVGDGVGEGRRDPGIAPGPSLQPWGLKYRLCELFLAALPHRQLWSVSVGKGVAVLSVSYDSCRRPEEPRRYRRVPRCIARQRARVVPRQRHVGAAPLRDKFGGLERHDIHPCPGSSRSSQLPLWVKPGQAGAARAKRGKREVLEEEGLRFILIQSGRSTFCVNLPMCITF